MNGYSSRTREIRCMDLGGEALGSYKARQGGCTHIQFFNQPEYLKCVFPLQTLTKLNVFATAALGVAWSFPK
ncbi:hypothetical protein BDR04DRAFT_1109817 [Suillus decipiens]|nr:hypothetical protein BDR04DRAFT_1109817 [Suillus decipiens]